MRSWSCSLATQGGVPKNEAAKGTLQVGMKGLQQGEGMDRTWIMVGGRTGWMMSYTHRMRKTIT